MRMKKFMSAALMAAMVTGLVGCGGTDNADTSSKGSDTSAKTEASDDAATGETKDVKLTVL